MKDVRVSKPLSCLLRILLSMIGAEKSVERSVEITLIQLHSKFDGRNKYSHFYRALIKLSLYI